MITGMSSNFIKGRDYGYSVFGTSKGSLLMRKAHVKALDKYKHKNENYVLVNGKNTNQKASYMNSQNNNWVNVFSTEDPFDNLDFLKGFIIGYTTAFKEKTNSNFNFADKEFKKFMGLPTHSPNRHSRSRARSRSKTPNKKRSPSAASAFTRKKSPNQAAAAAVSGRVPPPIMTHFGNEHLDPRKQIKNMKIHEDKLQRHYNGNPRSPTKGPSWI
jgi:hypothetical protein